MAVLMSYCPLFWGSMAIYNHLKNRYMFESYEQQIVGLVFYGCFVTYCPHLWGSMAICMVHKNNPYMSEKNDKKIAVFAFYGLFDELLPTV